MSGGKSYIGKYRGFVVDNVDPMRRGRVKVKIPVVDPDQSPWAMPCFPVLGRGMGLFAVPPVGARVWIEFEQGDLDYPIWTGCFGDEEDIPGGARGIDPHVSFITLSTTRGNSVVISDLPPTPDTGGIVLTSTGGARIVVNDGGIFITNGKGASITLAGPAVDINGGALTIL